MRKRLIRSDPTDTLDWLDLTSVTAEMTSESPAHPIEDALLPGGHGWQASEPGPQTIRLIFDHPQRIKTINLSFNEADIPRTQEFVLRWSSETEPVFREIVRQQWNFSPPQTTRETENYSVALADVKVLELAIFPDISGGNKYASLETMRLA
jgi:hypothetical protein